MDKRKEVVGEWRIGLGDMMKGHDSYKSFSVKVCTMNYFLCWFHVVCLYLIMSLFLYCYLSYLFLSISLSPIISFIHVCGWS